MSTTADKSTLKQRLWQIITAPFSTNLQFFTLFAICGAVFSSLMYVHTVQFMLYIIVANVATAYVLAVLLPTPPPFCSLTHTISTIYKWLVVFIVSFVFIVECFSYNVFNLLLDKDLVQIALGTDPNEAGEFIDTFLKWDVVLTIVLNIAAVVLLFFLLRKLGRYISRNSSKTGAKAYFCTMLALVAACLILSARNTEPIRLQAVVGKVIHAMQFRPVPPVEEFIVNPKIEKTGDVRPRDIVIIVGESFVRKQSSLFGYDKATNPRLGKLNAQGDLTLFGRVESPMLSTVLSFKQIMSTFEGKDEQYWRHASIPEVAKLMGYKTYWLSGQNKAGFQNQLITRYAELCDTSEFTSFMNKSADHPDQRVNDAMLLPVVERYAKASKGQSNLFIIHLLGSHFDYSTKFTPEFAKFKPSDYPGKTELQSKILSDYDKSLLYNDFVVNQIIQNFIDRDAIVFYFSDHGVDLFESSPTYFVHGSPNDPVSAHAGRQIPFIVYTSKRFRENHPALMARMNASVSRAWNTRDMIYTLMDLCSYKFAGTNAVEKRSLFLPQK